MRAEGLRLPAMDLSTLRAWWWQKQGLDGSLKGADPAAVLGRCGWARSVGGVGPYLMFFSRAGVGRERADNAVEGLEIADLGFQHGDPILEGFPGRPESRLGVCGHGAPEGLRDRKLVVHIQ